MSVIRNQLAQERIRERIYPNINSAALRASDNVYYQQSKESDVGSLVHAHQSRQWIVSSAGNKIVWIGCTVVTEYRVNLLQY